MVRIVISGFGRALRPKVLRSDIISHVYSRLLSSLVYKLTLGLTNANSLRPPETPRIIIIGRHMIPIVIEVRASPLSPDEER